MKNLDHIDFEQFMKLAKESSREDEDPIFMTDILERIAKEIIELKRIGLFTSKLEIPD